MKMNYWIFLSTLFIFILLICATEESEVMDTPSNQVVEVGGNVELKCRCRNKSSPIHWKLNTSNSFQEINTFHSLLRNFSSLYRLFADSTGCTYDLKIINANHRHGREHRCIKSRISDMAYAANVIVVENEPKCEINDSSLDMKIAISCKIVFYAESYCRPTPIWYDLDKSQVLSRWWNNVEEGFDDGYLWLSLRRNAAFKNKTRFGLSVEFHCDAKSQNVQYADNLPVFHAIYTSPPLFFSGAHRSFEYNVLLTMVLIIVVLIIACLTLTTLLFLRRKEQVKRAAKKVRIKTRDPGILSYEQLIPTKAGNFEIMPEEKQREVEDDVTENYNVINDEENKY